ncbi:MAG: T9SS type A sorting domain-containing protein [Dysgonamonadaceae bacterium]|jgi:hypothetical protein|nr:T9SS type A sorting domain-containing protein [Dysgonamonadaceae bacterium]
MKKLFFAVCFITSTIASFAQTFNYSDLDKGYTAWESINSFCFDLTENKQSQTFPLSYDGETGKGSYTPWSFPVSSNNSGYNNYQISFAGNERFRPVAAWTGVNVGITNLSVFMPVYGGWIPATNSSDYIKKNILKRVYYGDDAGGLIYLRELSATTHPDDYFKGSLFCFAPYVSVGATNFNYNTGFHFSRPQADELDGFPASFHFSSQNGISDGTIATRAFSVKKAGNMDVFNVSDWTNATWAKDVESYQDATGRVRNLNGGVEVYVVYAHQEQMPGYAGAPSSGDGYYNGTLDGVSYPYSGLIENGGFYGLLGTWLGWYRYANLGRVHVYPSRPKWKESAVKPNYCSSDVVDLLDLIDLGSGKFSGKFAIERGDAAVLDGTTLDFSKLGVISNNETIGVRCYPYYTEDNDFNISMYMEITVRSSTQVEDTGEQKICSGNSNTFLTRYLPVGGTYTGSYIKDNTLNVPDAVKANLTAIAVTYKYAAEGCITTKNYTQVITNGPDITFDNIADVCLNKEINLENYAIPAGGTFTGRGIHDNIFYPDLAGTGEQTMTYTLADENCETVISQDVIVRELNPVVTFKDIPAVCQNVEYIDLKDYLEGFDVDPGGVFSGTGVQNTHYFYPAKAKVGINIVTYTYGTGNCKQSIKAEITVKEVPTLSFASVRNICTVAPVDLSNVPNIRGGTFTGVGVQNNILTPELAGLGTVMLSYTGVAENGCIVSDVLSVLIADLSPVDVSFEPIPQFCHNDNDYYELSPYVIGHNGGLFSGKGVNGGRFYPAEASAGFNVITYTYGSGICRQSIQTEIYVKAVPSLSFASVGNVCTVAPVDLSNVPNIRGGTFTGAGVSGNLFSPEITSAGVTEVHYAVVSETGCIVSDKFSVVVTSLLPIDVKFGDISEFCGNDGSYYELSPYIIGHSGGTFSGKGVENDRFYPNKAAAGFNTVTYTYGSGVCRRSIQTEIYVNALPVVSFSTTGNICDKSVIDLTKYVTPAGGTFTGIGVNNGKFYPAEAGLGLHTITYDAFVGNCPITGSTIINVVGLADSDASIRAIEEVCKTSEDYIDLRGYLLNAPDNGVFTGTGVENNRFYPAKAKDGFNVIRYNFTVGTCNKTITSEIFVKSVPVVSVRSVPAICDKTAVNLSNYVDIKGGLFSGIGISGDMFIPDAAGIGQHNIKYTVQFGECFNAATMTMNVLDLRETDIVFNEFPTFCKSDSSYIDLRTYIRNHEGGTFAGTGIENYRFYPSRAREGFNTISYTYGDGSCRRTIFSEILIRPAPTVNILSLPKVCQNDITLHLGNYVSPAGGVFTGIGITSNGIVETASLDIGKYNFYYDYRDNNMCWNKTLLSLDVVDLCSSQIKWKNTIPQLCNADNDYIDLRDYIENFIEDGVFSGTGVENYRFYPTRAKVGFNTVSYTYGTGVCKKTIKTEIVVNAIPAVNIGAVPKICQSNIILDLSRYITPVGGSFSGVGVTPDGIVTAVGLGIGKHELYYDYQNDNACSIRTSFQVDVVDLCSTQTKWSSALPQLCDTDSSYIELSDYIEFYHGNGTFSGSGVENNRFYPSKAKAGFNTISYIFGEGVCKKTIKAEFFVKTAQTVLLNNIPRICDKNPVDMSNFVNIKGGDFYYGNKKIGVFYPENFGIGKHALHYQVSYDGCISTVALVLEVADLMETDIVFDAMPSLCNNDDSYYELAPYIRNHTGGTFTGAGVENNRFYPVKAKTGFNTITYTYGDGPCKKTVRSEIFITAATPITVNNVPRICSKDTVYLSDLVSIKGGTFSYAGAGIPELFIPASFGIGRHEITYNVTHNQCVSATTFAIEVLDLMEADIAFDSIPVMCNNDGSYYELAPYVRNHSGGTFTGAGVENNRFYPAKAKEGFNTIVYSYGDGSCKKTIRGEVFITAATPITVNNVPRICSKDSINLSDLVSIKGGTFSHLGMIISEFFRPESFGVGQYIIDYAVNHDQCISKTAFTIEILDLMEAGIKFDSIPIMCKQDLGFIDLRDYIRNHEGGTFTGAGVENNRFYPSRAKEGFNTITYTYGFSACQKSIKREVEIVNYTGITVSFVPVSKRCDATSVNLLNYVNIKTGTFHGPGVVDTIFYPDVAGIGKHDISYVVRDSIFNIYTTTTIEVVSLLSPNVRFKTLPMFCRSQGEAIDLMEYIENSDDGIFTGKGVKNNRYFYPNEITTEDNVITYTYGADICKRSISTTLKVYSAPNNGNIEIDDIIICCGSSLDLGKMVVPAGGTFTGEYITPAGIYSGNLATTGEVRVVYSIANKGCILSKEIVIKNEAIIPLDFSVNVEVVGDGGKVRFIPPAVDEISYRWDFGDGAYSFEASPWHYYYHPGIHTVSFEMKDRKGCLRTVVKENYISVVVNENLTTQSMPLKAMYVGGTEYVLTLPEKPGNAPPAEELAGVQIYPNPTNGICWIKGFEQIERIIILDASGEILQDMAASSTIHISGKAGIYLARCIGKNKQIKVIKIVKQ